MEKKLFSYSKLAQECAEVLMLTEGPAQDYTLFFDGQKYGFFRNGDFEMGRDPGVAYPIGEYFGYTEARCFDMSGSISGGFAPEGYQFSSRCILALKNEKGWTVYGFDQERMNREYSETDLPGLILLAEGLKDISWFNFSKATVPCGYAPASPNLINELKDNQIFVFGSNLQGKHGGGAAAHAYDDFGAVWGQGVGLQGRSYAIPTMQGPVSSIKPYVDDFLSFAKAHPDLEFLVTRIGCGIAGFTDAQIAPLFKDAAGMQNIRLPENFLEILLAEE